jgi:PAT family beta-lactamase induction signal transducer AmpG
VFLFLASPAGAAGGFVIVALGYRLSGAGVPVARTATLLSFFFLVQGVRWLWAPLVDATLTRVRWYLMGWALCIGATAIMSAVTPSGRTLILLAVLVVSTSVGAATISTAIEGLVATSLPPELKGRAGGWEWAGINAGQVAGGGGGLWLLQHVSGGLTVGLVLGALSLMCTLPLRRMSAVRGIADAHEATLSLSGRVVDTLRDLIRVARSSAGAIALVACLLPLGAGAANSLWAAVAPDWHATADTVALVTGGLGPLLAAAGCAAGGWASDTLGARRGYVMAGAGLASVALVMAAMPRVPVAYIGFTLLYQFAFGAGTGTLAGLIFATIGRGAASTKCATFFGFMSVPSWYMTLADGWAHDRFGPEGMLAVDALAGLGGLIVLVVLARVLGIRLLGRTSPAGRFDTTG